MGWGNLEMRIVIAIIDLRMCKNLNFGGFEAKFDWSVRRPKFRLCIKAA